MGTRGGYLKQIYFSASWHEIWLDGNQHELLHCLVLGVVTASALRNTSITKFFSALLYIS
jgi:hypothetical protein